MSQLICTHSYNTYDLYASHKQVSSSLTLCDTSSLSGYNYIYIYIAMTYFELCTLLLSCHYMMWHSLNHPCIHYVTNHCSHAATTKLPLCNESLPPPTSSYFYISISPSFRQSMFRQHFSLPKLTNTFTAETSCACLNYLLLRTSCCLKVCKMIITLT